MTFVSVFVISFVACNKDDDDIGGNPSVIEIKNVIGDYSEVATVKVVNQSSDGQDEIASGKFKNGKCKITLPKTLSDKYMFSINEVVDNEIVASDKNAKISGLYWNEIIGYDNSGNESVEFWLANNKEYHSFVVYVYADRKFTLKGSDRDGVTNFDCEFKKGWNIVYHDESAYTSGNITTNKPSGMDYKWYCND